MSFYHSQRRPSYYGDLFIANKDDVDTHIKNAYAKQPKLKVGDNRCGDSHWCAANNSGRKSAKLDETGLEIAGHMGWSLASRECLFHR